MFLNRFVLTAVIVCIIHISKVMIRFPGSCAYDLCAIHSNGVQVDVELWLKQAVQMLSDTIDIDLNTISK